MSSVEVTGPKTGHPRLYAGFEQGRDDPDFRRPNAVRPWQHVLEPIAGYLLYAQKLFEGVDLPPALNFGPWEADVQPVGKVVKDIAALWGPARDGRFKATADPTRRVC